jgi:hypothetical protein
MKPAAQKNSDADLLPMVVGCSAASFLIVAAVWLAIQAIM